MTKAIKIIIDGYDDQGESVSVALDYPYEVAWESLSDSSKRDAISLWLGERGHIQKGWKQFAIEVRKVILGMTLESFNLGVFTRSIWDQDIAKKHTEHEAKKNIKADSTAKKAIIKADSFVPVASQWVDLDPAALKSKLEAFNKRYQDLDVSASNPMPTKEDLADGVNQGKVGVALIGTGLGLHIASVLSIVLSSELSFSHPSAIVMLALASVVVLAGAGIYMPGLALSRRAKKTFKDYNKSVFSCRQSDASLPHQPFF